MVHQTNPFLNNIQAPLDLSELGNVPTRYTISLPSPGGVPAGWLPKSSNIPQGAFYNPKIGYIPPKTIRPKKSGATSNTILPSHGATAKLSLAPEPTPNSITPISSPIGFATVDGKRINYEDIGKNKMGEGTFNVLPPEPVETNRGGLKLDELIKAIQTIQPIQNYTDRVNALNTGNTTWDMNSLDKILAAKAEQAADENRYISQTGALANLGSALMSADAAKEGYKMQAESEAAKNKYMAPYYESETKKNESVAKNAPIASVASIIESQNKLKLTDKDRLAQAVKILEQFGASIPTDPSDPGYELYHNAKDTFDYLTSKRK